MFQDEVGFGRISNPKRCWAPKGIRPIVPRHHIREFRYAYGAIEILTGDSFFLVLPYANSDCMNTYLAELSAYFPDDFILLCFDQASWHTAKKLDIPTNTELFYLLPATPEMNPVEPIWKESRSKGFKNESFTTLTKVVDRLCETIMSLTKNAIKSITGRGWILDICEMYWF